MARRTKNELYLEQIRSAQKNNRHLIFETSDLAYLERIFLTAKKQERFCKWTLEDEKGSLYVTECEQRQLVFEGTPKDNSYRFCPYCGKQILDCAE